jgi:hypothetical protein
MSTNVSRKLLPASIIILVMLAVLIINQPVVFQEGNPLPVISAIIKIEFGASDIIQVSSTKYMQKAGPPEPLNRLLAANGWRFVEQLGAGYFYTHNSEILFVMGRMLTSRYFIYELEKPLYF